MWVAFVFYRFTYTRDFSPAEIADAIIIRGIFSAAGIADAIIIRGIF
jgi:hypothetical protein